MGFWYLFILLFFIFLFIKLIPAFNLLGESLDEISRASKSEKVIGISVIVLILLIFFYALYRINNQPVELRSKGFIHEPARRMDMDDKW